MAVRMLIPSHFGVKWVITIYNSRASPPIYLSFEVEFKISRVIRAKSIPPTLKQNKTPQ